MPTPRKRKRATKADPVAPGAKQGAPRCGLCGKSERLTRTECCEQWICDDWESYQLFSYARNSCSRNHQRYTLCAYHHGAGHAGRWQECDACRREFETEIYVYSGTNEYNFERLADPPTFEPTLCSRCGKRIDLGNDGYMKLGKEYHCDRCGPFETVKRRESPRPQGSPRRRRP